MDWDRCGRCYLRWFLLAMLALAAVSLVVGVRSMQGDVLLHSHHPRRWVAGRATRYLWRKKRRDL